MTCQLETDAKLQQSVPCVVDVNVAADLRQGLNVPSTCVCQSERSGAEVSSNEAIPTSVPQIIWR